MELRSQASNSRIEFLEDGWQFWISLISTAAYPAQPRRKYHTIAQPKSACVHNLEIKSSRQTQLDIAVFKSSTQGPKLGQPVPQSNTREPGASCRRSSTTTSTHLRASCKEHIKGLRRKLQIALSGYARCQWKKNVMKAVQFKLPGPSDVTNAVENFANPCKQRN